MTYCVTSICIPFRNSLMGTESLENWKILRISGWFGYLVDLKTVLCCCLVRQYRTTPSTSGDWPTSTTFSSHGSGRRGSQTSCWTTSWRSLITSGVDTWETSQVNKYLCFSYHWNWSFSCPRREGVDSEQLTDVLPDNLYNHRLWKPHPQDSSW